MCPIPPRKRRGASSTVSRPFRFGERGHTCARRRRLRRLRKEKAECVLPADSLSGASDCNSKSDRSFRSRTAKDNQKSIVLATELKRNDQTIIVPLHLSVMEDGEVWFLNKIPTAYEKKSFDLWIEEGLLLGYDAEKGPLIVPSNHRSNSRRSVGVGDQVTPPNGTKKSPSPKPAVYRNQTLVGDTKMLARLGQTIIPGQTSVS